ncbi:MAG TPA: preprotein translocase subunit SecA [Burkholderiales bacterium]|nr:preprotein translocase subunit SecA [Burkholderiales bacterium]
MSELALPPLAPTAAYPEQAVDRPGLLDRIADGLAAPLARRIAARRVARTDIAAAVRNFAGEAEKLADRDIVPAARALGVALRREGFREPLVAQSFALVREVASRTVGMRHFDSQLRGGWIMLNGMIAEMDTGEGKTLAATLPACTAALAGLPVHIISVNDYLTARDAETMGPVYKALGLTVGAVVNGMEPAARRAAYGADVTYCTNKELTFDYLRDRIALGSQVNRIQLSIARVAGGRGRSGQPVLRGLFFAIVDEADSVLVDEARTPLIISARSDQGPEREMYETALTLAGRMVAGQHYVIEGGERHVRVTPQGRETLAAVAGTLPVAFRGARRREELVSQALVATHVFKRDTQYIVRDEKVQIIDESTGRILPDRSWEQGLHQMVEAKEGVPLTTQQMSVARMTYQRFFRRYLRLAGMTGTAQEIASELWSVYRLPVARVEPNRPVLRKSLGTRVYPTAAEKWQAVVARAREVTATGRPVLIGTRSVGASEELSKLLTERSLEHQLLNARQDKQEAEIVAQAGQRGRITVATNMAGRGTDIRLGKGIDKLSGLHVFATELHESRRIDRQLYGRCGRQGDPGSYEVLVSLEDELCRLYLGGLPGTLAQRALISGPGSRLARRLVRYAQWRAERGNAAIRRELLTIDEQLGDLLAFAGKGE